MTRPSVAALARSLGTPAGPWGLPPEPSLFPVSPPTPQRPAEDVVTVASKFKQRYECRLPPAAVRHPPDPQDEAQLYNGSGVAELLRPMGAAPCLVKVGPGSGGGELGTGGGHPVAPVLTLVFPPASPDQGLVDVRVLLRAAHPAVPRGRYRRRGAARAGREGTDRPRCPHPLPERCPHHSCLSPQSRRSKETSSSSATTSRPLTGTTRAPRSGLRGGAASPNPLRDSGESPGIPVPIPLSRPPRQASKQHRLKRYHSQSYGNGSRCDLTGRAREAEVRVRPRCGRRGARWRRQGAVTRCTVALVGCGGTRRVQRPLRGTVALVSPPLLDACPLSPQFLCEEGAGDYLARVDEPQSCSYVLTVHTGRLCRHPLLRPPAGAAPQPIRCQPALTPRQYVQYVRAQVCEYRDPPPTHTPPRWDHGRR